MRLAVIIFILLNINISFAQNDKPIDMAKELLSISGVKDTTDFYSDDLDLRPGGMSALFLINSGEYEDKRNFLPDFSELISTHSFTFREFTIDSNYEIINVTAVDRLKKGFDFYLYFTKNKTHWELSDIRRLERGTVAHIWFVEMYQEDQQIDSIINSKNEYKAFQTRKQYDYIKKIHDLALNFDDSIIQYFEENYDEISALKDHYYQFKTENQGGSRMFEYNPHFKQSIEDGLCITEVKEHDQQSSDFLAFIIIGNSHGAVGYIHIKDKSKIPELISSKKVTFVREIKNGWYLYKARRK